ncbi:MAG: nicotinate-nucleotide--dimethylbenzimidazole phosphoribosyltransferase [Acidobacteriota bacterium]
MNLVETTINAIAPVDRSLCAPIQAHLDNLTKPRGSLGQLESIAMQFCVAAGTQRPRIGRKVIYSFAADHGVTDEGVSAFPKAVTRQMVANMLNGGAAVNVLARHVNAEVRVVDVGVDDPLLDLNGLIRRKVRSGTRNMARGPAMTEQEARSAVEVGIELAIGAIAEGAGLLGTGEMGIGNTTPSSAILATLLPCDVPEVTGRGTGIDDVTLKRKIEVIRRAIDVNRGLLDTPFGALAAVGGLEIAGICGLILGAASRRIPVVVDGFISSAGAMVATKMCPHVTGYLFYSHRSNEAGHSVFLDRCGIRPILALDMRLGEGTGAALAMSVIEAAIKIYNEMATFDSAAVSRKEE